MTTLPTTVQPASGSALRRTLSRYPLSAYFVLAYLGSWIVWLPMFLAGLLSPAAVSPGLKFLLTVLGPFAGPTLAAFVVTAAIDGKAGVQALRSRYLQWRFGLPWYLLALLGAPLVLSLGVAALYGIDALQPVAEQGIAVGLNYAVTLAVNIVLGGILAEEPGWRGFALPRMQARYGALIGSIILGVLWSGWHLPLILMPGSTTWTGSLALFTLLAVAFSILHTWVSNSTQSSLLSVILLHAAINTSTRLILPNVPGLTRADGNLTLVIVYGAVALLVVAFTKGHLAYRAEH